MVFTEQSGGQFRTDTVVFTQQCWGESNGVHRAVLRETKQYLHSSLCSQSSFRGK